MKDDITDLIEEAREFVRSYGYRGFADHTTVPALMAEFAKTYHKKQLDKAGRGEDIVITDQTVALSIMDVLEQQHENMNTGETANSDLGAVVCSAYCENCGITNAMEAEEEICLKCGTHGYCSMAACENKVQKILICVDCEKVV